MFKGNFIDNLPKIYGTYTGGFIVFIILMAIAEQAGMTAKTIGILFVAFTVCIYALIGYLSRILDKYPIKAYIQTVKATNKIPIVLAVIPACSAIAINMMNTMKPPVYVP